MRHSQGRFSTDAKPSTGSWYESVLANSQNGKQSTYDDDDDGVPTAGTEAKPKKSRRSKARVGTVAMSDSEKSRPNGSESTRSQTSLRGPRTTDPVLHELLPAHFNYTSLNQAESELAPRLAHGLERVLFSPGPVLMRDPRTRTFNFSNDIYRIPNPKSFDFSRLSSYVTASEDKVLQGMALEHGQKYYASTSSITTVLSKIILAISGMRPLNLDRLTMPFMSQSAAQTTSSRGPTGVILRYNDGVYGVDMYKRGDSPTVLMELGRVVEKMLCTDTPIFKSYLNNGIGLDELNKDQPDVFHFAKAEGFLLRAQIDCQHPALPGKTFDLKTRATLAIRMDQENYESNLGYRLRKLTGLYESFEREYYDMLRSALLKYSLQVRIGNMDGIFVCYHNTAEMFGFQYVPLEDMDHDLFGNSVFAQQCFAGSLQLLRRVFDAATLEFPGRDVKLMFSAPKEQKLGCYVLAKKEGAQLDVWDESKILKFTIETRSIINGFEVNGLPFVQDIETDQWRLQYSIATSTAKASQYRQLDERYTKVATRTNMDFFIRNLRRNSTFEDDDSADTEDEDEGEGAAMDDVDAMMASQKS